MQQSLILGLATVGGMAAAGLLAASGAVAPREGMDRRAGTATWTGAPSARAAAGHVRPPDPQADSLAGRWTADPPVPLPVTNNAVAALQLEDGLHLFSFLGLDPSKRFDGIVRGAFEWRVGDASWREIPPVPGGVGRLAATAVGVKRRIYLFGGYTVDREGREVSLPSVDVYDPRTDVWSAGPPIPVPVDDAVAGVWRDSLVYLVSGWSQRDNVSNVQVLDVAAGVWHQATPIPGPPVFGHAGAVSGNRLLYCDGVTVDRGREPAFQLTRRCFLGEIDPREARKIRWEEIPPHPGGPRYRAAAGTFGPLFVFTGGTDNPYNYDGVGYDGRPSEPRAETFAYDPVAGRWLDGPSKPVATMDHRALVGRGGHLWTIGGMVRGRAVTGRVDRLRLTGGSSASRRTGEKRSGSAGDASGTNGVRVRSQGS